MSRGPGRVLAAGVALAAAACAAAPVAPPQARVAVTVSKAVCGDPATLGSAFDETLPREAPDPARVDAAVRHFTNAERCERGRAPVAPSPALQRAAARHAANMVALDFFSHEAPPEAGGRLRARVAASGVNPLLLGENIAAVPYYDFQGRPFYERGPCVFSASPEGRPIPPLTYRRLGRALVDQWMASPEHRDGLLDPRYDRMGAGAAIAPDEQACGMVYAAQNFAGG